MFAVQSDLYDWENQILNYLTSVEKFVPCKEKIYFKMRKK